MRPDWDEYFMGIAKAVSARGDCTRRQVGAVIAKDHRIVGAGYNGAPAGEPGCLEGACPRGRHYLAGYTSFDGEPMCACGNYQPCPHASEPGCDYSNCIGIHAEANAIIYARYEDCRGAALYITHTPCSDCLKLIRAAGIAEVVSPQ